MNDKKCAISLSLFYMGSNWDVHSRDFRHPIDGGT